MELSVVKTGAAMFDALHAYGVAVVAAYATLSPVVVHDEGVLYHLACGDVRTSLAPRELLQRVLALPTEAEIMTRFKNKQAVNYRVGNLDGLLAALFTAPGVRIASVFEVLTKQRFDPFVLQAVFSKVTTAMKRWEAFLRRASSENADWLKALFAQYDRAHPCCPVFTEPNREKDISVLLALDPAFSFSPRRAVNDGMITNKTNLTIQGTSFAAVLAFIGAARFLRAQHVTGSVINVYVALPQHVTIMMETSFPSLRTIDAPSDYALVVQWLQCRTVGTAEATTWKGLAFQVLLTQGKQQSISQNRGVLDVSWLYHLEAIGHGPVLRYWTALLNQLQEPGALDNLVTCLVTGRFHAWFTHLWDVARWNWRPSATSVRTYSTAEVQEITRFMSHAPDAPLSMILERKQGTLRFGHALRLLGRQNAAILRELVDALDTVKTRDQLLEALADVAQACVLAHARSNFIVVPSDDDLYYLLDDVERHGPGTIAKLVILLASLRYPATASAQNDQQNVDVVSDPGAMFIPNGKGDK